MSHIQPTALTYEELLHYAQMYTDRKESMPLAWQDELVKRGLANTSDKR